MARAPGRKRDAPSTEQHKTAGDKRAKKEAAQAAEVPLFQYGVKLLVKGHEAAALIGHGGSVIKGVRAWSGASVRVLSADETTLPPQHAAARERIVLIQGGPFAVCTALTIAVPHMLVGGDDDDGRTLRLVSHNSLAGSMIGPRWSRVRAVADACAVHIHVSPGDEYSASERLFVVREAAAAGDDAGDGDHVRLIHAVRSLLDHAAAGGDIEEGGSKPPCMLKVLVANGTAGLIIGSRGETREMLARQSGAQVQIGKESYPGRQQRSILLAGGPLAVSSALAFILKVVFTASEAERDRSDGRRRRGEGGDEKNAPRAVVFADPEAAAGNLIGRGGANIREIRSKLPEGTSFTVADAASCGVEYERLVTIHGAYMDVHRAAGELLDCMYAMEPEVALDYRAAPPRDRARESRQGRS